MAAPTINAANVSCEDFSTFQLILRQMRTLDDRLIHALNTSLPTDSFRGKINETSQCKEVYEQMLTAHTQREDLIKRCVSNSANKVNLMREERMLDRDNLTLLAAMRKEQTQLRLLQSELGVEEVVQDTANKPQAREKEAHPGPAISINNSRRDYVRSVAPANLVYKQANMQCSSNVVACFSSRPKSNSAYSGI